MRRIFPLLALAALAACGDLGPTAPAAPGDALAAKKGGGTEPPPSTAYSVTATITGPSTIGNAQSCVWTGSGSGGTAPYTLRWMPGYTSPAYFVGGPGGNDYHGIGYYSGSSPSYTTVWLTLEVTDALGAKGTTTQYITLWNYAIGCI